MKSATLPQFESERLAVLARYNILDTPPEPALDKLTRLASQLCQTPIAMITLIDQDRQWFKSTVGWQITETPRAISICAHTILQAVPLIVSDLQTDDRFQDNPLVREGPRIRFYAGVPLATPDGYHLGTLCVLHRQPSQLSPAQVEALNILAHQVMTQLELQRRLHDLARAVEEHKEVEQRLQDSELFYQTLVESLPQNIIRKDAQGRFTFANDKFCQSVGRTREELLGKTDSDLFPAELASKYHRDDLRVMATQENLDTIEAHQTPDGHKLFVHVIKTPLYDAQGAVVGIQGIFWDVTQRKKIEEALAYERDLLRALLEHIPDRIYFKDIHSRFLRCSTSLCRHLNVTDPKMVVGKTDFDFRPREVAQAYYNDEQRIILTGQPIINKVDRRTNSDGAEVWSSVTKVPIYNRAGAVTGIIGITRDVTQLKQTEQELERARDAALESVKVKSQFLANMSHEIRTPMNAITGMTSLLKRTRLSTEQQECVDTIGDSTSTLLYIINEILDYSKIEVGKIHLEQIPFDLLELVESTIAMLADPAQQKRLELACWIDPAVPTRLLGDPGRFRQVLTNLLSNAVKFTEQGEVLIRMVLLQETPTTATIQVSVSDTGIGIAREAYSKIFEAFTQADGSTTRRFGGTGLGLTISRHLVQLMGGDIQLESHLDQGSRFWFKIPFRKQSGKRPPDSQPALDLLRGKRVLVVDDSATTRQILLDHLAHWHIQASEAASHAAARQHLVRETKSASPFDLVLLDLEMPDGNGLNLACDLQSDALRTPCRVVAITSSHGQAITREMQRAGILALLKKPVRVSRLLDCLVRTLRPSEGTKGEGLGKHATTELVTERASTASASLQILLAEDNPVNQRVALRQLQKLGYEADAVPNGSEVLAAMKLKNYDIILMDCQMPELDGYETSRRIRNTLATIPHASPPVSPHPYIIALTANTLEGDRERCLEAGMNDYLTKPIDIKDLEEVLHRAQNSLRAASSPTASPADASQAPLDFKVLESLSALKSEADPDPLSGLISLYLEDSQKRLSKIEAALAQQDTTVLAGTAHSLKGSSNNLGARRLGEICGQLEKHAKASSFQAAADLLPELKEECHRVERALQTYLRTREL